MALRVTPVAPIGSLLKGASAPAKRSAPKQGRERDDKHLAAIRRCPCVICGRGAPSEAAHVRLAAPGKREAGIGAKPDDRWVVPLCVDCHAYQHSAGERRWWATHRLDPLKIADDLYRASPDVAAMRKLIGKL